MSRRPRLVEEGQPIDTTADVEMTMENECRETSFPSNMTHERVMIPSSMIIIPAKNSEHLSTETSSSLAQAALDNHRWIQSTYPYPYHTRRSSSTDAYRTTSNQQPNDCRVEYDYERWSDRNPMGSHHNQSHRYHHHHHSIFHDLTKSYSHSFVIGQQKHEDTITPNGDCHRMEIEDIGNKPPLLILDGANIAYSYAQVAFPNMKVQIPHVKGIQIAVDYFLKVHYRVQVVIPTSWIRSKRYAVLDSSQLDILHQLQTQNLICCTPPTDDDDAYALAMARREDSRARVRKFNHSQGGPKGGAYLDGGAFVVSNDLYRDAIERDGNGELKEWLEGISSWNEKIDSYGSPGRISYSFCDLGSIDRYGSPQLDFVPNPRHPLIQRIEEFYRKLPRAF